MNKITVTYHSIDGVRDRRSYKTLAGARKFAHHAIGAHPEIGSHYAISGDGVGRITSSAPMTDLFPEEGDDTQ